MEARPFVAYSFHSLFDNMSTISGRASLLNLCVECLSCCSPPLNKHRLVATVDARKETAAGLLEKLGFRREAHFCKSIFFKGEWGNEYAYALLRSEWK